jgi:hypothetical protein
MIQSSIGLVPDFRELYPYEPCREPDTAECSCFERHAGITPRGAYELWWACGVLADEFREDVGRLARGEETFFWMSCRRSLNISRHRAGSHVGCVASRTSLNASGTEPRAAKAH